MASSAYSDKAPDADIIEKKSCPTQVEETKESESAKTQEHLNWDFPVPEKSSWPELVGATGEAAKEAIKKENHDLDVIIMPPGAHWTYDYRSNRVRVAVDSNGIVTEIPRIG